MIPPAATDQIAPVRAQRRRALTVILVADGSGSMSGERIGSLNWAAKAAIPALIEAAAEHPDVDVSVRVMRFADTVDWPQRDPMPLTRYTWTNVAAAGESRLGAALLELATVLSESATDPSDLPPVLILLSDGYSSDDPYPGLAALLSTRLGGEAVRVAIAIGSDADHDLLKAFTADPASRVLRANNAETLASRIRWTASAPIAAAAPPAGDNEPEAGLVW